MHGDLSIGTFIALYSLLDYIIIPTVQLPFMLNALNRSIASIHRIQRMEGVSRVVKKPVSPNNEIRPTVKAEDVHFSYDRQKPVLTGFSFEACNSGMVAFKGASGSGKTTLLDLLCGLYSPQKGSIEICGLDPAEYDISGFLSVVSQDVYLFPASIRENIRCAKPEAGDDEVKAAAIRSGAHAFVSQLLEGYDTVVGDGYTGLSGGQKQRIALAQAILKNAPVWLLDEPTSALDSETEKIVLQTIREVSKEKLILVSAHRASFLEVADRVIALESEVSAECIC
jgi:ABC-type multidrug transport system fused ATPase/permease subunit